jgi:uncharacterized RDD family membrane protein YckC
VATVVNLQRNSLGEGFLFRPNDYVGFGPRMAIFIIDSLVILFILGLLAIGWRFLFGPKVGGYGFLWLIVIWTYVVALKRSKFRTLGYRCLRCKLVTLQGQPPTMLMLTVREFLWILFFPSHFFLDFIWCGIDQDRQTLRDCYTSMQVLRNDAVPIGSGQIHLTHFFALGFAFNYPRVSRPKVLPSHEAA